MECPKIEVGIVMLRNFDHYILINEVSIVRYVYFVQHF